MILHGYATLIYEIRPAVGEPRPVKARDIVTRCEPPEARDTTVPDVAPTQFSAEPRHGPRSAP